MMYNTLFSNIFDIAMSPLVYWKCIEGEMLTEKIDFKVDMKSVIYVK